MPHGDGTGPLGKGPGMGRGQNRKLEITQRVKDKLRGIQKQDGTGPYGRGKGPGKGQGPCKKPQGK